MTVTLVAAVAENGVIGRDGAMPWRLPEDLARLKRMTLGHVVIMGRRTYEAIGRPLPGRSTVVVTATPDWSATGVVVATSIDEALSIAHSLDEQVYVLGGAEVYRSTLPIADRLLLTEVTGRPDGDTYFPPVDWSQWREMSREDRDGFVFVDFVRR